MGVAILILSHCTNNQVFFFYIPTVSFLSPCQNCEVWQFVLPLINRITGSMSLPIGFLENCCDLHCWFHAIA
jgi:hypothetical protein